MKKYDLHKDTLPQEEFEHKSNQFNHSRLAFLIREVSEYFLTDTKARELEVEKLQKLILNGVSKEINAYLENKEEYILENGEVPNLNNIHVKNKEEVLEENGYPVYRRKIRTVDLGKRPIDENSSYTIKQ